MDTFGQRIQRLREEKGLSQRALGDRIGVSGPTVFNWESETTDPDRIKLKLLQSAAKALQTSVEYLLSGKEPESAAEIEIWDEEEQDGEFVEVLIPVLDVRFAAGPGAEGEVMPEVKERLVFQRSWLKKHRFRENDLRVATVMGDSMQPLLWEGDKVVIDLSKKEIQGGKVYALRFGNELRVKRLEWTASGDLRIVSLNSGDEIVPKAQLDQIEVFGQVVSKMGSGGL